MKVGQVIDIKGENGATAQAKIVDISQYRVEYKIRNSTKGPFKRQVHDCSRRAFKAKKV